MSTPFRIPDTEIQRRIARIQTEIGRQQIDALFIVQRVDLFYFTGTAQHGYLYVPAEGEPTLFVRRYGPRARQESGIGRIVDIGSTREISDRIDDLYGPARGRIGFELDVLPVRDFYFFRRLLAPAEAVDGSASILGVRSVKSSWELAQMEASAALSARTFAHIPRILAPGLTEMEFAGQLESFARAHGHGGMLMGRAAAGGIYTWHVVSGKSGGVGGAIDSPVCGEGTSPAFPSGAGHRRIESGEPVMVDFGTVLNGYHTDETRMFAVGSMPEAAKRACRAAADILQRLTEAAKPGVSAAALFDLAEARARHLGYESQYLGLPGAKSRFVGHGVGAELVEPPMIAKGRGDVLVPGMVLALEPKMCFAGRFGIGIESMVAVTETGSRLLSQTPADVVVV